MSDTQKPSRALSIRQPWAWAIFCAGKNVENRTWYTHLRGTIYVHASRLDDAENVLDCQRTCKRAGIVMPPPSTLPIRALLGTIEIVDCFEYDELKRNERRWACGPFCFMLANPVALSRPKPMNGKLGFWRV